MTCRQLRKVKQPRRKQTYQTNRQFPKEPKMTNKLIKTDHLTVIRELQSSMHNTIG